mmetsp:Transcript_35879/g.113471  ORF Transcript_35879/g.113471 Transcript_35879/m.113471 type:complete len:387 (-) Transcript_35879:924-2084(-)
MDLLLHGPHDVVAHIGVDRRLHLLLERDLALPEHDLPLHLDNLGKALLLVVLRGVDAALHPAGLRFQLFKLGHDLRLQVEVVVRQKSLEFGVLGDKGVEAGHVIVHVQHRGVQPLDGRSLLLVLLLQARFFLSQHGVLALEARHLLAEAVVCIHKAHELALERHPAPLQVPSLLPLGRDLLLKVGDGCLQRPHVLVLHVRCELLELAVEQVHRHGLLLDLVRPPADLHFVLLDRLVLLLQLLVQRAQRVLELAVVGLRVEHIHADLCELVLQLHRLDLLLAHLGPELEGVVRGLLRGFLHRRLLAQVAQHLRLELLDVPVGLHDRLVRHGHVGLEDLGLLLGPLELVLRLLERALQLAVGLLQALLAILDLLDVLCEELRLPLHLL